MGAHVDLIAELEDELAELKKENELLVMRLEAEQYLTDRLIKTARQILTDDTIEMLARSGDALEKLVQDTSDPEREARIALLK